MRIDKYTIKRIEGLTPEKSINNFKESVKKIKKSMLEEGWEEQDVFDYLVNYIENELIK